MTQLSIGRRGFLGATVASASLLARPQGAQASDSADTFEYPITRSEAEWRDQLSDIEHYVLRSGGTEAAHSSELWDNTAVGTYCCRGCDLTLYASLQKLELDRGWVFFRHSHKDTVMTDLDLGVGMSSDDPFARMQAMMEVHCRRCGSHLGHIVSLPEVPGRPIHCINGFALRFEPKSA